jgi:hypothetical protein
MQPVPSWAACSRVDSAWSVPHLWLSSSLVIFAYRRENSDDLIAKAAT